MMSIRKLNPWNWFRHEEEAEGASFPARRGGVFPSVWDASPLMPLHQEMERVFDDALKHLGGGRHGLSERLSGGVLGSLIKPHVDIETTDSGYRISAEIPGVDEKDIKVELMPDRTLSISGEKRQEHEDASGGLYRIERSYGSFRRILTLPDDANVEGIRATSKNGVLTLSVARKALAQPKEARQITITSAEAKPQGSPQKAA